MYNVVKSLSSDIVVSYCEGIVFVVLNVG
jgi:hypothetical protein